MSLLSNSFLFLRKDLRRYDIYSIALSAEQRVSQNEFLKFLEVHFSSCFTIIRCLICVLQNSESLILSTSADTICATLCFSILRFLNDINVRFFQVLATFGLILF